MPSNRLQICGRFWIILKLAELLLNRWAAVAKPGQSLKSDIKASVLFYCCGKNLSFGRGLKGAVFVEMCVGWCCFGGFERVNSGDLLRFSQCRCVLVGFEEAFNEVGFFCERWMEEIGSIKDSHIKRYHHWKELKEAKRS